ncbi:hypothetical protein A2397_04230 [Candidatus Amesbacteria bacterium RIFOXYB1_FULL_44_23]|uniref:Uncharacterized protein n=1 Tax=Candidatus Amesbacteria bacterium RIFOXYB1_FULL_44_23 TaxID=1797263 RepID=A0A1F4ZSL9_9BACT|nr:MAG: hypothetical protein A2397_04230 [Candidatus Amesbacteria bacterium RIFOXYB1_FULL_44_23]
MSQSAILNASLLRSRLKLKSIQSGNLLTSHHGPAVAMLEAGGVKPGHLRAHAAKLLSAGAAAASVMLSPVQSPISAALPESSHQLFVSPVDFRSALSQALTDTLPPEVRPLTSEEESTVSRSIHDILGIHAYAELEGNHLNTSYGLIGQEQHLPRFPGDSVSQHDALQEHGITPGRGAWGYFVPSKDKLTPQTVTMEKYYVAVQTLYLPDWNARLSYLRDWYKYRKVVVINPHNGRAVVAVVADSGPAAWTGKHFGGSPEVMEYLRRQDGKSRGPVVMFFVDDPENRVPLGPLEYNLEQGPALLSAQ